MSELETVDMSHIARQKEEAVVEREERTTTTTTETTTQTTEELNKALENQDLIPASLLIESQQEITSLRERITHLQRDLHDAQDFVFSLQPRQQTLTESEAITDFTSLCAAVEEWVDQKLGDALEDMTIATELRTKDIQNLMNLITAPGKLAFHTPMTDVDNIQAMILRYLTDCIFSQDFYCPLGKGEREFVTMIERAMRDLTPKRDTRTIRHWHIETYTALSSRPGFAGYATERMRDLTVDITALLLVFAPTIEHQKLAKSFFESIIKPASELARKMHLSFDEFTLQWSAYHDTHAAPDPGPDLGEFEKEKFAEYEFVDLSSRKTLREKPREDVQVRWMFDLSPRLVVKKLRADSWGEGKTLVRPRVLVSVTKAGLEKKDRVAAQEESNSNPTVLVWLEKRLRYEQKRQGSKPTGRFFGFG
ncbi:hypothetical protein BDW59DRAFT_160197 [Aspergillus cavernicola]|uniref:Uncharacterized protein n=1 Tax=Aspergillus cavernicola TaxID=176166 RepID=A0ABR4IIE7_9EURO